ncbi:MAG: YggS family pyridoxal phosphate-dependent enzyme [Cyclobacteriaceae bacterium]|jgi:hypothetical protein|nr:YggS family pyridoxal phosphate-dependent enzyme [Cyclobacteriaceae bacterium]
MSIKSNIEHLERGLGRGCRLIAVSKTQPLEKIHEAYNAGHRLFGENKVQELVDKYQQLPGDIEWHLIGHLQTNKVKYIAPFVSLIHSVDSEKLLVEINKQGAKANRVVPCLIQLYIAQEDTKFGADVQDLHQWIRTGLFDRLPFVEVRGLMGMASLTADEAQLRQEFRTLKQTFEALKQEPLPGNVRMQELSMGMSADYPIAVEEGSTLIRIGTAIFGNRT